MSLRLSGASARVKIIAPLPGDELAEVPTKFVAVTLAQMLDPQGRL